MDTTDLLLAAAGAAIAAGGYYTGRAHTLSLMDKRASTGRHARPEPARATPTVLAWFRVQTRCRPRPTPHTANPNPQE